MGGTDLVRARNDGDQFHYVWAARRCLLLLMPNASLKAITIEGASPSESDAKDRITTGEELIDVGEYEGSENIEHATLIRYIQLKHSTVRTDATWTPSELEKTILGFAKRYTALKENSHGDDLEKKLEFWFVSNRPINTDFLETIQDAARNVTARHAGDLEKLKHFTSFDGNELANFCKLLHLDGGQEGLWDQQNILTQDVRNYLADADVDAPVQLKELVTKKALSISDGNPVINRIDVLRALKTDESHLFPAPCLIKDIERIVPREQELELINKIIEANKIPVIVHASAGVGKSVFATRIKYGLPKGSLSILYDCFGNGQYRSVSGRRHHHKDALVQIANELATRGLCHPLIPTTHADSSAYMKAFLYRLSQSIISIRSKEPQALLCIIIDAADNAQMAADDNGEAKAFVLDLIREQLSEGVRLVFLCRTHRQEYILPPPSALRLELNPFNKAETKIHLQQKFVDATEQDVEEFDRLSSHNPRVQAIALSQERTLSEILRNLGPNPTTVDKMIEDLLSNSVAKLRDDVNDVEKDQIDRICAGLAILRPLIPLSVLASLSGVSESAIKSFALELGRPLLVMDDTIQFYDEPAETWFRDKFKPTLNDLSAFVVSLKQIAISNTYAASVLPQLMLEAGQFAELVELALTSGVLPSTSPVEKRDIELQRLQFALKASLRTKRYTDAAKLALKAGGKSAGDERQRKLFKENTDLTSVLLGNDRIQEIVSRRIFNPKQGGSNQNHWIGYQHAYEAGLLSGRRELLGEASSRLRMTREWLRNWSNLSVEEKRHEEVMNNDILEIAIADYNIYGADSCAQELRGWRPREVSFNVGRMLASRFIDHGRYNDIDKLALAAGNNLYLVLALTMELRKVHRIPPKSVVGRTLRLVLDSRIKLEEDSLWDNDGNTIGAVTALVEASYKLSLGKNGDLISLMSRYLPQSPPRGLANRYNSKRFSLLRGYALKAELCNQSLNLIDLAHDELRKELENPDKNSGTQDAREFREDIGALLPWHILWARTLMGRIIFNNIKNAIDETKEAFAKSLSSNYREKSSIFNEAAEIWLDILMIAEKADIELVNIFDQWISSLDQSLFATTLTHLARLSAQSSILKEHAIKYAKEAFDLIQTERENAESKADSYIKLARAILIINRSGNSESAAYFNQAVEIASKIGDENYDRWRALLDLANRSALKGRPNSEVAYRLARCAELTYDYVVRDKYFDWVSTVEAISGLCGRSTIAILSRWRDRDFGWAERILPIAIDFLVARGDLASENALALLGFRAHWNEPFLLERFLTKCIDQNEKEAATEIVYRYMTQVQQDVKKWSDLKNVLLKYNIPLLDLDERINLSEREEQASKARETNYTNDHINTKEKENAFDWSAVFEGFDLSNSNDIVQAYRRFVDMEFLFYHERFFEEAYRHVSVGKEAEFIVAFAEVMDFSQYHLSYLLKQLPEEWKKQISVKVALAKTLKEYCKRFCMEISKSRFYEVIPYKAACELSGITECEIVEVILNAIGEADDVADPSRLFTLVGLLAPMLTENEALEVLVFGLDLFDSSLKETDGDGPWTPKLEPPVEIESAVAGYIWGGLAAPRASLRWEAAHVVRALCKLKDVKVLKHLIALANGESAYPFYDCRLQFYDMHARQWLLIGLARASLDSPEIVAPYADMLIKKVFEGEPHYLIREFAKRTLRALLDAGFLKTHKDLKARLAEVNVSPFQPIKFQKYQQLENVEDVEKDDEDRYYFGIDFGPYWLAPLGRHFGIPQATIEREILKVIRNDWKITCSDGRNSDERHKLKIFKDMETYHSHGSYPRVDDLRFYHSYHAMMVVIGHLMMTVPVHYDPEYSEDSIYNWINDHDLVREDGKWLADLRDPDPLERPTWKDVKESEEWRWSIVRNDFDKILQTSNNWLNVWGYWKWVEGQREEKLHVSSALVSPGHAMSLLRALQSSDNHSDYRIPPANDHLQIDFEGFQLKGWIDERERLYGIDSQDPWAGAITYPPTVPALYITQLMKLNQSANQRCWYSKNKKEVIRSQVWGHFSEKPDNDDIVEHGTRLQASFEIIIELLNELEMDMIIQVQIERRKRYSRWERSDEYELGYIPPSTRLFLVRANGSISTL